MFTDWVKIHYLGQEKSNSLHGSTQVVNIHYFGQIKNWVRTCSVEFLKYIAISNCKDSNNQFGV